jgi:Major intrinsic protein
VNPARSTDPAILLAIGGESWALGQLWLFWVAPIVGGFLGALIYRAVPVMTPSPMPRSWASNVRSGRAPSAHQTAQHVDSAGAAQSDS